MTSSQLYNNTKKNEIPMETEVLPTCQLDTTAKQQVYTKVEKSNVKSINVDTGTANLSAKRPRKKLPKHIIVT